MTGHKSDGVTWTSGDDKFGVMMEKMRSLKSMLGGKNMNDDKIYSKQIQHQSDTKMTMPTLNLVGSNRCKETSMNSKHVEDNKKDMNEELNIKSYMERHTLSPNHVGSRQLRMDHRIQRKHKEVDRTKAERKCTIRQSVITITNERESFKEFQEQMRTLQVVTNEALMQMLPHIGMSESFDLDHENDDDGDKKKGVFNRMAWKDVIFQKLSHMGMNACSRKVNKKLELGEKIWNKDSKVARRKQKSLSGRRRSHIMVARSG